jgi:alkylation response protein AidB-like acyl-CoA dehydrogenase
VDFSLSDEQRAWQLKARRFAEEDIRPLSLQRDAIAGARETFDWEIIRKGSRLGFRTAALPRAWGGHGIDFVTQALVMAELARADSAISKTFSQCWKFSQRMATNCTDDQKQRFLTAFVADDCYLLGSASTEPNAGSDNRLPPADDPKAGWKLQAVRDGDEWILNGEKCFIANGSVARLFIVSSRTDPNASIREGSTMFMVPVGTPGFRIGKVFNKRGWRFYQNAELIFENARVPHANVLGEVNGGSKTRGAGVGLDFSDFELASNALGVCEAAVEQATQQARSAQRGGGLHADQQTVQLKLAEMHMLTESLRSFVLRTAWEMDQKVRGSANAQLVMLLSSETIQRVARLNMDIHGALPGGVPARAEKLARDSMIWTHLAGASVQRMKAARHLLK